MVAGNVQERDVQECDDVLKIWIRKVPAPNDQFNIVEMAVVAETVKALDDFIADGKDFHCAGILP